jgi:TonB family protein
MRDGLKRAAIGKYQLIAALGQGGMANVYLALVAGRAGVNKLMVVKVVANEMLHGPEGGLELFWDEARLAARLVHPNIVHTYEVGEEAGDYFLVMEYLEGQTLRKMQGGPRHAALPRAEELRILCEVARGLHYAHQLQDFHGTPLNVVHRDISPQNVFVTYDGQVKLIDFGIAKSRDAEHETRSGLIKGKLNYIAPEQVRGEALDGRADIFALGVMLWETVAGRRFSEAAAPELAKIQTRLKGGEPNIRSVQPDVPEALARIIDRAIHLDVQQRWPDAAAFADALEAYIDASGERPGARSLAAWMQQRFAHERAAMQAIVDERIQFILQTSSEIAIDKIPTLPTSEGTGSVTWQGSEHSSIKGRAANPTPHDGLGEPPRKGQWLQAMAVGAGAVFVVAGVAALFKPADPAPSPTGPAHARAGAELAARQAPPVSPAAAPAPAQVTIQVKASPEDAQVSIDGAPVELPFSGVFIKSAVLHRIAATAPGHKPAVQLVDFGQDRSVELTLAPIVDAAQRRTARVDAEERNALPPAASASQRQVAGEAPVDAMAGPAVAAQPVATLEGEARGPSSAPKPAEKLIASKDLPGNKFPPYPKSALRRGLTGSVVVAFDVLPDGKAANPTIVEGSEEFHETVLQTVRTWRFQPATQGGRPVVQRRSKTIEFNLDDD